MPTLKIRTNVYWSITCKFWNWAWIDVSTDEGLSGTYHHVPHRNHLTSKMEDAANNCCIVTTLRNCGCGSAPHLKAGWGVHWPSRYFHPSLLLVAVLILVSHHCFGKAACWLWKEEQTGTCNLPYPTDVLCCCWALKFHSYLEHSHFIFFIDIGAT